MIFSTPALLKCDKEGCNASEIVGMVKHEKGISFIYPNNDNGKQEAWKIDGGNINTAKIYCPECQEEMRIAAEQGAPALRMLSRPRKKGSGN